ncbi:hypothetical protein NC652_018213 [Populus alba x Populus x berolinensis]|nr:hypothetical protein NC652_018213 [Populus alba x Populus x berolinensis]
MEFKFRAGYGGTTGPTASYPNADPRQIPEPMRNEVNPDVRIETGSVSDWPEDRLAFQGHGVSYMVAAGAKVTRVRDETFKRNNNKG